MRYLNLAVSLVVVGSASAFACGGDSGSISSSHGGSGGVGGATEGGAGGSGGISAAGKGGTAGTGTAGTGTAGTGTAGGGAGGANEGGAAGEPTGAAGEGGAAGEAPQPPALQVTISGVPDGQVATATVNGPGAFTKDVSATTTLSGVAAGSYTVTTSPASFKVTGPQVDSIFDGTVVGSPADVEPGPVTSVAVNYTQRGGTGMLWATNWATHNAFGFSAAKLAQTGAQTAAPDVTLTLPDLGVNSPATTALAFSATNDAWLSTCHTTQKPQVIGKFGPAKLAASGSPTADVEITLPATDDCASALAFDASGNLWVGLYHGSIVRYNASDLATSGTPTPAVTLTNTTKFVGIVDLAFDTAGNLFVGAYYGSRVSRLSASQLTTSNAAIVPDVVLTLPAGAGVGGLSLGAGGNLWVADYTNSQVLKYDASALTTSGTPTPSVTLTGIAGPEQLAFDKAGNLWIASFDASKVIAIAAADLTTSGAPTPLTTFTGAGALNETYAVRFSPAP